MKETRYYKIKNKVFNLGVIEKIALKFETEYKKSKKSHHSSLAFSVTCTDGSIYESEDTKIFNDRSIIQSKRVHSLKFWFKDYENDKNMQFDLENGNSSYSNVLVVSGNDSTWVNGTLAVLQEQINEAEPQSGFFRRFNVIFIIVSSISIGIIFVTILAVAVRSATSKPFINPFKLMFEEPLIILLAAFIGYFPSSLLSEFIGRMWPKIELQLGPSHTFIEKNRRNLFFSILILLILPIIISWWFS